MANTISKASLLLSVNGTEVDKGLQDATTKLNNFKSATEKSLSTTKLNIQMPKVDEQLKKSIESSTADLLPNVGKNLNKALDEARRKLDDMRRSGRDTTGLEAEIAKATIAREKLAQSGTIENKMAAANAQKNLSKKSDSVTQAAAVFTAGSLLSKKDQKFAENVRKTVRQMDADKDKIDKFAEQYLDEFVEKMDKAFVEQLSKSGGKPFTLKPPFDTSKQSPHKRKWAEDFESGWSSLNEDGRWQSPEEMKRKNWTKDLLARSKPIEIGKGIDKKVDTEIQLPPKKPITPLAIAAIAGVAIAAYKALDMVSSSAKAAAQALHALYNEFLVVANAQKLMAEASRDLGVSTLELNKMQSVAKIAGVDIEVLKGSVLEMKRALRGGDADLIFQQLGLSWQKLAALPIDEQFQKIAGALALIKDPAEQARIGFLVFPETFGKLYPLLSQGSDGIKKFAEEAAKSFSGLDSSKLEAASQNIRRMEEAWSNLKSVVASQLAPVFEAIAEVLIRMVNSVGQLGTQFAFVVGIVTLLGIQLAKSLDLAIALGKTLYNIATFNYSHFGLDVMAAGLGYGPASKGIKDFMAILDELEKKRKKGLNTPFTPPNLIQKDYITQLNDFEKELRKSQMKIGLTAAEAKFFDINDANKNGLTKSQQARREVMKGVVDMNKSIETAMGNVTMDPLEVWSRSIEGLDNELKNGRLTLDQYRLAVVKAKDTLESSVGGMDIKTVSAAFKDTSSDLSAQIKYELQSQRQDPARELNRALDMAEETRKKQLAVAVQIKEALEERAFDKGIEELLGGI